MSNKEAQKPYMIKHIITPKYFDGDIKYQMTGQIVIYAKDEVKAEELGNNFFNRMMEQNGGLVMLMKDEKIDIAVKELSLQELAVIKLTDIPVIH